MASFYLGLDCSTQSLSAILIDYDTKKVIYERAVHFDRDLPHYGTIHGYLPHDDPGRKHSPPLMWVEALDLLFHRMQSEGVEFKRIAAISGSAQQHGSIYLNARGVSRLSALDPAKSLKENLQDAFSQATSPIWMDSSTTEECREIREALGGLHATIETTGSDTFERFTGPQIRKFYKKEPEAYARTASIALVSSFLASIMTGTLAPIDYCDGSGMNLMDIRQKAWHLGALEATAPDLASRLPPLAVPWKIIGSIGSYFVHKYGLRKETQVVVFSGDNPNSLIGLGVIKEGLAAISLGTSFTYFGYMPKCHVDLSGEGHLFVAPTGDYMSLNCFTNGALAIEKLCSLYSLDWKGLNEVLKSTPPGNRGGILLPYFEAEIVPRVHQPKLYRLDLAPEDIPGNCRALIEAQMMSMRLHSKWMQIRPAKIYATGGASVDPAILQVMADVNRCPVFQLTVTKSAALGAALRAIHGSLVSKGLTPNWEEIVTGFTASLTHGVIEPSSAHAKTYGKLIEKYASFEKKVVLKTL